MTAGTEPAGPAADVARSKFYGVGSAPRAGAVVYAFGQCGTGAGAWRPLQRQVTAVAEVRAARLPGRENRFLEQPMETLADQVADLGASLPRLVRPDPRPFRLLGWCASAITAFEHAGYPIDHGLSGLRDELPGAGASAWCCWCQPTSADRLLDL
jgi:hypothetical protein